MSNRKLKRNVVFEGRCYCQYQAVIIEWHMDKFNSSESDSLKWYINSGLAEKFEKHHRPHNSNKDIIVSEIGQTIGE